MTDKEKIRAEVERRYNEKDRLGDDIRANVYKSILRFIDSMQEEPKFKVGDRVKSKIDGFPICTIEGIDDTTYYCDYTNFDILVQDCWELVEEPKFKVGSIVKHTKSEKEVVINSITDGLYLCDIYDEDGDYSDDYCFNVSEQDQWELIEEEPKKRNATGKLKECIDTITEESLTKARKQLQEELVNGGLDLGCGVIWKDEKSASGDLEKVVEERVDATVHIDAGGYPYIPQIELYDYDKDIPLAKGGDKYKVILIKEE